jgi:hypothetical protein
VKDTCGCLLRILYVVTSLCPYLFTSQPHLVISYLFMLLPVCITPRHLSARSLSPRDVIVICYVICHSVRWFTRRCNAIRQYPLSGCGCNPWGSTCTASNRDVTVIGFGGSVVVPALFDSIPLAACKCNAWARKCKSDHTAECSAVCTSRLR